MRTRNKVAILHHDGDPFPTAFESVSRAIRHVEERERRTGTWAQDDRNPNRYNYDRPGWWIEAIAFAPA